MRFITDWCRLGGNRLEGDYYGRRGEGRDSQYLTVAIVVKVSEDQLEISRKDVVDDETTTFPWMAAAGGVRQSTSAHGCESVVLNN